MKLPRFFFATHPTDLWLGIGICLIDGAITISLLFVSFGLEPFPKITDTILKEKMRGDKDNANDYI